MFKYLTKRIIYSIFSLIIVVGIVMVMIFQLLDRNAVFKIDPIVNKLNTNEKLEYKNNRWEELGYIDYIPFSEYVNSQFEDPTSEECTEAKALQQRRYADVVDEEDENYKEGGNHILDVQRYDASSPASTYIDSFVTYYESQGYTITAAETIRRNNRIESYAKLFATKDIPLLTRLGRYFKNMISFDSVNYVEEYSKSMGINAPESIVANKGVEFIWDKSSNMPAIVGTGTEYRYLLYFDNQFPYIHQNFIHFNLGLAYTKGNKDVTLYMSTPTGTDNIIEQVFPTGYVASSTENIHSIKYSQSTAYSQEEIAKYGEGSHYINVTNYWTQGRTQIGNSFFIGILATLIAYLLGIPLGILMSKNKDRFFDKLGICYIVFIMAVPSLAYIFMFRTIGVSLFKLPSGFASDSDPAWLIYILPVISLALPSIGGLMKWVRRYMIDQTNSDYVKFARAEGLSEGEIFTKHIARNAIVPIAQGIPGSILGCLTGAIITESVYSVPGIGKMLTQGINDSDNGLIIGATVFYTALSIISLILGDLMMAAVDPRISFTDK